MIRQHLFRKIVRASQTCWFWCRTAKSLVDLRHQSFEVRFPFDGDALLELPKMRLWEMLTVGGRGRARMSVQFANNSTKEGLFRTIAHSLLASERVRVQGVIVDIGAWLGDNAIPWAQLLRKKDGEVYAIDPSLANVDFGRNLAILNGVSNISWMVAACAARDGLAMRPLHSIDHTSFEVTDAGCELKAEPSGNLTSSSLDSLVSQEKHALVDFMHLDVEGLELEVLQGAVSIIDLSRPVVAFECHVSTSDLPPILAFFAERGYHTWMINEVIPGNRLDCRNFLAIHCDDVPPNSLVGYGSNWGQAISLGIPAAVYGDFLVPVPQASNCCRSECQVNPSGDDHRKGLLHG